MRAAGNLLIAFLFAALASGCRPDASPVPPGYPSSYASLITQARNEGVVTVYSVTDRVRMASLLSDFEKAYPGVTVRYVDLPAQGLFRRVVDEAESRSAGADVIWSSAMDLQVKLVNDGYAEKYASPESAALPEWAVWKEEAFGVTAEPIVFAYNRAAFADLPAPASHAELTAELERSPQRYHGKIITYDPESSAAGYLYLRQDEQASQDTWRLIRAMADANVELSPSTDRMLEALASGERLIAYNLIGSYAYDWARRHPVRTPVIKGAIHRAVAPD